MGVPADSIPAGETPMQCVERSCAVIVSLVGVTTLQGERARAACRDILAAVSQLVAEAGVTQHELEDCLEMAQAGGE